MQKGKPFRLIPYLLRHSVSYFLGIVTLCMVDLAAVYIPQYTGEIIDALTEQTMDRAGIFLIIGKIIFTGLIMVAGRFCWRYFIVGGSRAVEYEIRNDMFAHLETLSLRYYHSHKTGDLMAHFTNDLQAVRMAVGPGVITSFDAAVMSVFVLTKMVLHVDLKLTILAVLPLLSVAFACYFFGIESKKRQTKRQEAFSALSDQVQESISGIRVIKAFVQEEKDQEAFDAANRNNMEKNLSMVKLRAIMDPLLDVIIGVSILITLLAGGKMVLAGEVTIGQFVAFNSYINLMVWPMIACGDCINMFSQASAALQRISAIFEEMPDIVDKVDVGDENSVKELHGEITFNHLTFQYPDGEAPVLKDLTFDVHRGETLAILGRTGSGKSTLSDLLLRVYDCESGMLLLDGTPIDQIPMAVLHRDIAYVPQDNFLFSDTLEENIAFGLEERIADHPEIRDQIFLAAKAARIHDNIMEFPEGYRTIVGERGVTLSGGQKQRSSIARALLKEAPILILDDSLSAVDTDTEEAILNNLKELRRGKTTIIIAHRISTIQNADHIAVFREGALSEYGNHEELLEKGGFYYHMYEKQQLEKQLENMEGEA